MSETPARDSFSKYRLGKPTTAIALENDVIWGGSVIRDDAGTYHMFASYIPEEINRWIFDSKVVRATADSPVGPFELEETALPGRPGEWDEVTHNPTIHREPDGTYLLYYTGTQFGDRDRIEARDNQRIGLATAESPSGPWTRHGPVVHPGENDWDSTYTTNPAPCVEPDGSITMVYKSLNSNYDEFHLSHGVVRADTFDSRYERVTADPILDDIHLEDPYIWREDGRYHMLIKDFDGEVADQPNDGIYAHSEGGIEWTMESGSAYRLDFILADGTSPPVQRRERPQVLLQDGKPSHLYTAVEYDDDRPSNNVVAPIVEA
jgi:hypothetical protein